MVVELNRPGAQGPGEIVRLRFLALGLAAAELLRPPYVLVRVVPGVEVRGRDPGQHGCAFGVPQSGLALLELRRSGGQRGLEVRDADDQVGLAAARRARGCA